MPTVAYLIREGLLLFLLMGIGGTFVTLMCRGRKVGVRGIALIWLVSAPLPLFVELVQIQIRNPLWGYGIMAGILTWIIGILAIVYWPDDWLKRVTENLTRRRALS